MEIDSQQARQSLADIKDAAGEARRVLIDQLAGRCFIWWGSLLVLAYGLTYFLVVKEHFDLIGYVWWGLMGLGGIGGWLMERSHPMMSELDARVGWFWLALCVFGGLWLYILPEPNGIQINMFLITLTMFAYVVLGLFAWPIMLWLGIDITVLIMIGYWIFDRGENPHFWIWQAACVGGPLIGTGLTLLKNAEKR